MNYTFAFYSLNITVRIFNTPRLSEDLYAQYAGVARFKANMHNVFIQARADKKHRWLKLPYVVRQEDILAAVEKWPDEWMKYEGPLDDIPIHPT